MSNNNQVNHNLKNPSPQGYSKEQEYYLALTYAAFHTNPAGKEWIEFMRDSFLNKLPVADPGKDLNHAFYREGQNSLIRSVFQNMDAYELKIKENNKSGD